MLAREEDELYSITYDISLSSFTALCPQLMQIRGDLVQWMGFVLVFTIRGAGQPCLLRQPRRFGLFFFNNAYGFNSLLFLCDCEQYPCDSGSPSYMGSGLHPHLPRYSPGCRLLPVFKHEQLGNLQQLSVKSWKSGCMRDYDRTTPLNHGHYVRPEVITNGWMWYQSQVGLIIHVRERQGFPFVS